MLLIAYPHLNFWFHAETGLSWLRDEESEEVAVTFHCLNPIALARVKEAELYIIQCQVSHAYNTYGATAEEEKLEHIDCVFIDRPEAKPPAGLPRWFSAIAADGSPGTWIIHTAWPVCAFRYGPGGRDLCIHPGDAPSSRHYVEADRQFDLLPAH